MGKWSTFLISLIPAGLGAYLLYLLTTIGLSIPDDKMGMMFWGPLGAGFLGCVMAFLTPIGIAIFVRTSPKPAADDQRESSDLSDDDFEEDELDSNEFSDEFSDDELADSDFESDDEFESGDFESDEFEEDSDADFQTAEFDSSDFDEESSDEFGSDFDLFDDDDDELA